MMRVNIPSVDYCRHRILLLILTCLLLAGIPGEGLRAGVTGKITGTVTMQTSGEPAIGVNVQVLETYLGAATDRNGDYFILQVPPGTYSMRISLIGYRDVVVGNVSVSADYTTRIDMAMEERALEMDEVVVTAKRPLVQKDVTSSIQFVGRAQLLRLPVTDTKEGLMLQTGVLYDGLPVLGGLGGGGRGEPRYAIRGGAQDQVHWYIDGVRTVALFEGRADQGGSFTDINIYAVEEIQVLTGGYNAEYGNVQSGIVNTITRDGTDRISGSFEYIYGLPGKHHFGPYIYNISDTSIQEFRQHTVLDADSNLVIGTLDTAWWTPYRQSQIYDYRQIPDRNAYFSLGGPLFKIGNSNATFFGAVQLKEQAYVLPHPQDTRDLQNGMLNIAIQLPPNKTLRLSAMYNHEIHSTWQEAGDFSLQAKYYRGWGSILETYTFMTSAQWTHSLSQELYYELKLSQFSFESSEGPSKYHRVGESGDQDIWGFQFYEGYKDEPFHEYAWNLDNQIETGDISLVGSLNWQLNTTNFLKSGFEYRYNTYFEKKFHRFPSFTTDSDGWMNRGLPEKFHPIQLAAYIQDKMEFEGMILNLGVRWDNFNPNRDWFVSRDIFNLSADPDYDPAADLDRDEVDSLGHIKYAFSNVLDKPRKPAPTYDMVSPRIGISFPMTDRTVLHFSYGHYYQMPPLDRMFELTYIRSEARTKAFLAERDSALAQGRDPVNIPVGFGDPERVVFLSIEPLRPEKTISFEVGLEHNFERFALLDVTAYYKDSFDQTESRFGLFDRFVYGYDPFLGRRTTNRFYVSYFPGDYGDARGFEISFRTLFSESIIIDLNYSFSKSSRGRASPRAVYFDLEFDTTATGLDTTVVTSYDWDVDVNKRIPVEKSFSRPHVLRVNLYLNMPAKIGGRQVPGLLQGFSASLLYQFMSGQTYTYIGPDDPPDTYDNKRYPGIETFDLKVEKTFTFGDRFSLAGYALVANVLNTKNVRAIGGFYDVYAIPKFLETGEPTTIDAAGYDISWNTYYEPRKISVGMRVEF